MSLDHNLLRTSRPVLFEHDDDKTHAYFGAGSCFIFSWRDRAYVLTAKHAVAAVAPDKLRVLIDDHTRDFYPIEHVFAAEGQDFDWKDLDLALFRVAEQLGPSVWRPRAFPIDMDLIGTSRLNFEPGRHLYLSGYPDLARDIDYD
jgi:hypothetical protein